MNKEKTNKPQQNYLISCGCSLVAAFFCVVLHPSEHDFNPANRAALIVVAFAMLGLFAWIVHKAKREGELDGPHQENSPESQRKFKKMNLLWSGLAILLSISLLRFPLLEFFETNEFSPRLENILSIVVGMSIIVFCTCHSVATLKNQTPHSSDQTTEQD